MNYARGSDTPEGLRIMPITRNCRCNPTAIKELAETTNIIGDNLADLARIVSERLEAIERRLKRLEGDR